MRNTPFTLHFAHPTPYNLHTVRGRCWTCLRCGWSSASRTSTTPAHSFPLRAISNRIGKRNTVRQHAPDALYVSLAHYLSHTQTLSMSFFRSHTYTHTQVSVRKLGASRSLPAGLLMRARRPPLLDGAPGPVNPPPPTSKPQTLTLDTKLQTLNPEY